ncbi:riboflavin synthase subunit alpha [Patescibacteria group bacterium]|nr:MAG: riboflavin synthase subunit alpha [Patescibacteria group bacterium]
MFTGIVQGTTKVKKVEHQSGLIILTLDLGELARGLSEGASVSVAGVCLTARALRGGRVIFDLMDETLKKTTLGSLRVGDKVNIERSVKIGDELGGHRVAGHVSGTAAIAKVATPPGNRILTIKCARPWMDYILPKGFIALDGCSLTVVDAGRDFFTVHLIPETLRRTTLGEKKAGDLVNLELDPQTVAVVETVKRLGYRG